MKSEESSFSLAETEKVQQQQCFIGRVLVKLQARLQSVQIKIMSLGKIVRLLQQYSEKKDQQYQKQSQNMQMIDARLSKIDSLQSQLVQNCSRSEQLTSQYHSHSLKIEHVTKLLQERQMSVKYMQERLTYEVEELNRKINKIESNMLLQIRQGTTSIQQNDKNHVGASNQNYKFEELSFRMESLEAKVWSELEKMKGKFQKLGAYVRPNSYAVNDDYGMAEQGLGRSKSRRGIKQRQKSQLKRIKSK